MICERLIGSIKYYGKLREESETPGGGAPARFYDTGKRLSSQMYCHPSIPLANMQLCERHGNTDLTTTCHMSADKHWHCTV